MDFREVGNFVICKLPGVNEINMEQVEWIVQHTHNTWQADRKINEIRENTIQGKMAEFVVERILSENSQARYISYDEIRIDQFKKHAPFDGIIYQVNTPRDVITEAVRRINNDVTLSPLVSGLLTGKTRKYLEDHGIYTIEIKSSLLQDPRDYRTMLHKHPEVRTEKDYEALCTYIRNFYDFFVYPLYCRDNINISNFYQYVKYVQQLHRTNFSADKRRFLYELMLVEFDHACDLYTRVFFDVLSDELIVPGYVLKGRFYEEPRIRKMPSPKSENAVYYMYHMRFGMPFLNIDEDDELWEWDRDAAYAKLFGAVKPNCPVCGNPLKIVEVTRDLDVSRHKFLYVCGTCPKATRWYELSDIHKKNMR